MDTTRETLARAGFEGAILDVACGTGTMLEEIVARRSRASAPAGPLAGVDLSPGMLEQARRKLDGRATLAVADAIRLPFRPGTFDVALSASALHHWRDPVAILREIRDVLRPGGRLVVTDWCADRWLERLRTAFLRRRGHGHLRAYRSTELAELLANAGFRDVRVDRWRSGWRWNLMTAIATRPAG